MNGRTVIVYEPRRLVREGIVGFLGRDGFDALACANADDVVEAMACRDPATVIISFDAAPLEAVHALERVRRTARGVQVLAVASVLDQVTARRLRTFGVHDVVSPDVGLSGLVDLLRDTTPPNKGARPRARMSSPVQPRLTAREQHVIALVSAGCTASQIATELHISAKTVENHKQRVFRKLGVQSQSHAVSVALRLGLLDDAGAPARVAGA